MKKRQRKKIIKRVHGKMWKALATYVPLEFLRPAPYEVIELKIRTFFNDSQIQVREKVESNSEGALREEDFGSDEI